MKHVTHLEIRIDGKRTVTVELDGTPGAETLLKAAREHAINDAVIRAGTMAARGVNGGTYEVQMQVRVSVGE